MLHDKSCVRLAPMKYTVKELAELAKVSVRTLHYYDQIDLLKPSDIGDNGYRYYQEEAVLHLQQIMFYRELEFSLKEIKAILDSDDFNVKEALESHRLMLKQKAKRLQTLMQTIDKTLSHMKGNKVMVTKDIFQGFDEATQAAYAEEAAQRWGEKHVNESNRRWKNYSQTKKEQILAEAGNNYTELLQHLGKDPSSDAVQAIITHWHQNIRYFYEPTKDILLGLAQLYNEDPRFRAFFEKIHPDLPNFLHQAIEVYCKDLEPPA